MVAIHAVQYTVLNISSCIFDKNVADYMGRALSLFIKSRLTVLATVFTDNLAKFGGALVAYDSIVDIEATQFSKNAAKSGGAVYAYERSWIAVSNVTFTYNTANSGVIAITGSTSTFSNTTHSNSIGSLLLMNSRMIFSGQTVFENNINHLILNSSEMSSADKLM